MIGALTAADIANTIRMLRTQHGGAFVLVEGPSDARLYGRFIDPDECLMVPAFGREKVEEVLTVLEGEGLRGITAILDKDVSVIVGRRYDSENIFVTDVHDLEGLLLMSPALEKVLTEFGSEEKLRGRDVRRMLLAGGERVGCLRLLSIMDGLNLRFDGLNFGTFVVVEDLRIDVRRLVQAVRDKSKMYKLAESKIVERLEGLIGKHDAWDVCCGHDLIEILCIGVRRCLGSCKAVTAVPEVLERSLRLAYEVPHFAATQLYRSIKAWEERHDPFRILAV